MDIKYLGHSSFQIKTKEARVVTDPYESGIGMKFPKTEADIVTISHHHGDHNNVKGIAGDPLVIDWPGEFEKQGVRIFGYKSYHDKEKGAKRGENNLYKFEAEGIAVLHCGDLGFVPDDAFVDNIGIVNILMIPVGGFYTIDPDEAVSLIKKVEPHIVIPMHYNHPSLKQETFGELATLQTFLEKMGATDVAPVPKLTVKADEFNDDDNTKIVVLDITS